MHLTTKEIKEFDKEKLEQFLSKKIIEGHHIDYKKALSGSNDKERKREFLKDVIGFANANGGNIFIGVEEPSDGLDVSKQIIGIEGGENVSEALERLARDCIDPSIYGLQITPIPISKNKHVLVVHIPPSTSRPHMADYKGCQNFYVRHRESTNPMTTHQIREAVLSSLSAEARAIKYMEDMQEDICIYDHPGKGASTILLQAIPLIQPEEPWDVLNESIQQIIKKSYDHPVAWHLNLSCYGVRPTLKGIKGESSGDDPKYFLEVHKQGYISVAYFVFPESIQFETYPQIPQNSILLYPNYSVLFEAFFQKCSDILNALEYDATYILRLRYIDGKGTYLHYPKNIGQRVFGPLIRDNIYFSDQLKKVGEDFESFAGIWGKELFHAFGLYAPDQQ